MYSHTINNLSFIHSVPPRLLYTQIVILWLVKVFTQLHLQPSNASQHLKVSSSHNFLRVYSTNSHRFIYPSYYLAILLFCILHHTYIHHTNIRNWSLFELQILNYSIVQNDMLQNCMFSIWNLYSASFCHDLPTISVTLSPFLPSGATKENCISANYVFVSEKWWQKSMSFIRVCRKQEHTNR